VSPDDVALFRHLPQVARQVPWVRLGAWPTPVEPAPGIADRGELWIKREDLSSPRYGGNKVRTLEAMFGRARAAGADMIWSTGAYGSNHAVATALHGPSAELAVGAIAFPQPASTPARDNLRALLAAQPALVRLASVVQLPLAMRRIARRRGSYVMTPGGATAEGALGALSAGLELAEQIAAGACPAPARIVLPAGSTCTTAGLLAGLALARELGVGFSARRPPPRVTAVRVTPWPITSPWRIAALAHGALALVDRLRGRSTGVGIAGLRANLDLRGEYFGGGYGRTTSRGVRAAARFAAAGGPPLDVVYAAKAAAAALALTATTPGPVLFWATKSSAPLPVASDDDLARAHPHMRAWLATG
jgi:D-cysteine desulfhydrase